MPVELTSFVGRVGELAQLRQLLGQARLLTLIGPGGVGKSRLALRAAAEAAVGLADGVRLVELSGLKGPELLPEKVAEALGLSVQAGKPQIDAVVEYVADRELLIVLDTCEHLVDACALLTNLLLSQAPQLKILATSRQALDIPGEYVLPVAPLGLSAGDGGGGEALELFEQRASVAVPGLRLTEDERGIAATLCRRLDGIPLAIELTAVRLRALPLEQLAARLTESFALLDGGRKGALPRHQTLRTAIGWSHELCSPAERLLWARLSAFAGSFDLAAVEAVCTDLQLSTDVAVDALIGLVDKSVLLRRGPSYRMLDTIREFGAEYLEKLGETTTGRHRLISYYQSRLQRFESLFFSSDQVPLYKALLPEHENLRAALEYAHAEGALLPLAATMWPYWLCSGQPAEACHWLELALAQQPEASPERARGQQWAATFADLQGDHATAKRLAHEMHEQAEQLGDPRVIAVARMCAGQTAGFLGDYEKAVVDLTSALEELRAVGTAMDVGLATMRLGMVQALNGHAEAGITTLSEVVRLAGENSRESYLQGCAYGYMTVAHLVTGDIEAAERTGRRSVELHDLRDGVLNLGITLDVVAWTAVAQGRHHRAALIFGGVDTPFDLLDQRRSLGNPLLTQVHAQSLGAAREALGSEELERLRYQGARLSREQLVAFALSSQDTLPDVPAPHRAPAPSDLTQREREVAALVARNMTNREIAERLVISKRTADAHVEHILAKLGYSSRSQIAALISAESLAVVGRANGC
ncbi:LuxR C-terminal-related transcriptional regulator [Streptomyces sp. NPDC048442]|uniref:ATP-binding protein n=1 Tax=Streptomyces sp. NPDC048442 TaxID=3154823 RepID=UPI003429BB13